MNSQFHGLSRLEIYGDETHESECVKFLPKEGWLPASLEHLELKSMKSVETLECKGLAHLTSLQELRIDLCPKLENMEGEKLPASLIRLMIFRTPLLGKKCEMKDPQNPHHGHGPFITSAAMALLLMHQRKFVYKIQGPCQDRNIFTQHGILTMVAFM
ncbi:hypothetical protein PIB30_025851 [Stylosanthes scabra]|uniref:Uncharacterized protein n=1 Tax=Stylosanthes scabra TaxID=79078 RepID=A0ABU6W8M4_9FABA|nr:hypothetical protein [Stylosanthes scabra]